MTRLPQTAKGDNVRRIRLDPFELGLMEDPPMALARVVPTWRLTVLLVCLAFLVGMGMGVVVWRLWR